MYCLGIIKDDSPHLLSAVNDFHDLYYPEVNK